MSAVRSESVGSCLQEGRRWVAISSVHLRRGLACLSGSLPWPQQCCTLWGIFFIRPVGGRCLLIRLQLWPCSQCRTDEIHRHGHFWCLPLHVPWAGSPEPGSECVSQGISAILLSAYWGVPESRILLWWAVCMSSFQQTDVLQQLPLGWQPRTWLCWYSPLSPPGHSEYYGGEEEAAVCALWQKCCLLLWAVLHAGACVRRRVLRVLNMPDPTELSASGHCWAMQPHLWVTSWFQELGGKLMSHFAPFLFLWTSFNKLHNCLCVRTWMGREVLIQPFLHAR